MSSLFELDNLSRRLTAYVRQSAPLKPEADRLLQEALFRGEFERGEIERITGLPERSARRVLNDVIGLGCWRRIRPRVKYRCTAQRTPWRFYSRASIRKLDEQETLNLLVVGSTPCHLHEWPALEDLFPRLYPQT
jgi:hypothetical protein